jgi:thiol-disulfide isomerase/thioredoxin
VGRRLVVRSLGAALLVALTATGLTACGRDQPVVVGTTVIPPDDRESMPPIAGTTLDGTPLDLADLRGSVVVLNAWASWCDPCRDEMPSLVSLDAATGEDVAVVGLDVKDDDDAARAFASELGVGYPSIVDADGAILPTIPGVPAAAVPSTVIVDRDGRQAARIIGEVDPDELASLVADIAAEPAGS